MCVCTYAFFLFFSGSIMIFVSQKERNISAYIVQMEKRYKHILSLVIAKRQWMPADKGHVQHHTLPHTFAIYPTNFLTSFFLFLFFPFKLVILTYWLTLLVKKQLNLISWPLFLLLKKIKSSETGKKKRLTTKVTAFKDLGEKKNLND